MEQAQDSSGKGFLQGIKKILFNDATPASNQSPQPATTHQAQATQTSPAATTTYDGGAVKAEIQRKILQLLDARNKQGIDFLEVWRAAQDMGGVSAVNIRAAFTSLRHADPTITREKLVQTAKAYVTELETAFAQESAKREAEKQAILTQKEQTARNLQGTIQHLEQQIATLQQTLDEKKKAWQEIQQDADPGLHQLEAKIRYGREAMDTVIADINQVVAIIQQELN